MTQIVPQTGQRLTALLDRLCPITEDTTFTASPFGIAEAPVKARRSRITPDTRYDLTPLGWAFVQLGGVDTPSRWDADDLIMPTSLGMAATEQSPSTTSVKDVPANIVPSQPSLAEVASLSTVDPSPDACPRCGARLGVVNLYCGGRGYVPYISCCACEYQRRILQ